MRGAKIFRARERARARLFFAEKANLFLLSQRSEALDA